MFRRTEIVLAFVAVLAPAARASAYRTLQDDPGVGYAARVDAPTATWSVSVADLATRLDPTALAAASHDAATTWAGTSCGVTTIAIMDGLSTMPAAPGDGRNTIGVVTSDWAGRGFPAGRGATTDVQLQRASDGTASIVEADIYLNLADFEFVFGSPTGSQLDVRAVLTHELGHALGLLHPCEDGGVGGAPDCATHPEAQSSALYPTYEGEQGRTLGADDVSGVCALYAPRAAECAPACASDQVCTDGHCVTSMPSGACSSSGDCSVGTCGVYGESLDRCVGVGSEGAPCMMGADCAGGLCLTSRLAAATYCTRSCMTDTDCESIDRCSVAEGRSVCSPRRPPAGCSVGGARRPDRLLPFIGLMVALVLSRRIRRGVDKK